MPQILYRSLADLSKLEGNPRVIKDASFKTLCQSIKDNPDYFEARPLILSDRTGKLVIIAGNQRYDASAHLKLKEVPTILLSGLTEKRERELVIRDNVNNGDWNYDLLASEWAEDDLTDWGVDLSGFGTEGKSGEELREEYSARIGQVVYEPRETNHSAADLFTLESKFDADIDALKNEPLKAMLRARAAYFSSFNYARIADYYAYQATPEEQRIFERLALVLLDKDQLVEHGFSEIMETVKKDNGYTDNEEAITPDREDDDTDDDN